MTESCILVSSMLQLLGQLLIVIAPDAGYAYNSTVYWRGARRPNFLRLKLTDRRIGNRNSKATICEPVAWVDEGCFSNVTLTPIAEFRQRHALWSALHRLRMLSASTSSI